MAATLRTFFAVEIGTPARLAAKTVQGELRRKPGGDDVRWVKPENLHVTVRFLGDVEADAVPEIVRSVAGELAEQAPFETGLGLLLPFPSFKQPRVVALTLAPDAQLVALAERVERGVVAAGLAPESRRFRPHLSLGRMKKGPMPGAEALPSYPEALFTVRELVLYQSELSRKGSTYTALERLPFGAAASP